LLGDSSLRQDESFLDVESAYVVERAITCRPKKQQRVGVGARYNHEVRLAQVHEVYGAAWEWKPGFSNSNQECSALAALSSGRHRHAYLAEHPWIEMRRAADVQL
jgi:hypothetical protein